MSSIPLQPKKCLIFWDFPMKNMVKIFVIPMSSLGGVHLISGIAHCAILSPLNDIFHNCTNHIYSIVQTYY